MVNYEIIRKGNRGCPSLTTGLSEWWQLGETAGNRLGSFAGLTMTDINSVGSDTGTLGSVAAKFVLASSQLLTTPSVSSLQIGDFDFSVAGWAYLDADNYLGILNKWETTTEYIVYYDTAANRFRFIMNGASGVQSVPANSFGAISTGVWYFVYAQHDATADTMSISVNNRGFDSISYVGGGAVDTNPVTMGKVGTPNFANGRLQHVGFWKRKLTPFELNFLYNGGNGRTYPFTF